MAIRKLLAVAFYTGIYIYILQNSSDAYFTQIKWLSENKLIIWAFGNLHYQISREKFKPEPDNVNFQRHKL